MFPYLAIFFILILLYSVRRFKVLINPLTIFILGFAIAGVMCLYYYDEWGLVRFRSDTFYYFLIGTLLYTITCVVMRPKEKKYICRQNIENVNIDRLYSRHLFVLMIIFIFIQVFICYYKYKTLTSMYGGNLVFAELTHQFREDTLDGETVDYLPKWFSRITGIVENVKPFIYLISGVFVAKGELKGKWAILFLFYIALTFVESAIGGVKGNAIQAIITFIIAWFIKYIRIKHKLCIPKTALALIGGAGVAILLGINLMNYWIGRGNENNTMDVAMYSGAVYCGAELKNMDIYMNAPTHSDKWGESTFGKFYKSLGNKGIINYKAPKTYDGFGYGFLSYGGYNLGNVYTIFCNLYSDFAWFGLILLPLMAAINMFVFKRVFTSKKSVAQVSIWEYFYITMAWHTFMSFFANRFYGAYSDPFSLLKSIILFYVFDYILQKLVYLKASKRDRRTINVAPEVSLA